MKKPLKQLRRFLGSFLLVRDVLIPTVAESLLTQTDTRRGHSQFPSHFTGYIPHRQQSNDFFVPRCLLLKPTLEKVHPKLYLSINGVTSGYFCRFRLKCTGNGIVVYHIDATKAFATVGKHINRTCNAQPCQFSTRIGRAHRYSDRNKGSRE